MGWLLITAGSSAQESPHLFLLSDVPQSSLENPAIQNNTGKIAIGIPVLSGVNINLNSNIAFNYLFFDDFEYSFHQFFDLMSKKGKVQAGSSVSIFFASLRHNEYTFSVSVRERGSFNGNFDSEIISFIRDGIINYYGADQIVGSAFFQFRHYKEVGIGVAKEFWDGFDIGIRPKILFGKYFLDTNDFDLLATTDNQRRELHLIPYGTYFMSGPLSYVQSFRAKIIPGDYFFQAKNLGFAFDAGIVLKSDNATELSVSLLDVGIIGFGHNVFDMKMARPWRYDENKLYQSHSPKELRYLEPREALKIITDSISYLLEVEDSNSRAISLLPMKLNIAGKYSVASKTALGLSNQLAYYRRQPINMSSVFIHQTVGNRLEMAGSLSLFNFSRIGPGFGASYSANWMQLFIATNNISAFLYPSSSKHLNLSFGINFLLDTP